MPPIYAFEAKHAAAAPALNEWCARIKRTKCSHLHELRKIVSGSVDYVGGQCMYIFNIGGNKYRILTSIHFNRQVVYIRAILTHAVYDEHSKNGTLLHL
ncbi:type II toxin-antitoxin system HigB family toxin [Chitinophaga sp. sic0106]|uniref:type II toxin-antitoxin system HigB family toxin n=1 Tax=Chitinophaga sp. sic0106 TaxID=2854785 RepID=UPI00351D4011